MVWERVFNRSVSETSSPPSSEEVCVCKHLKIDHILKHGGCIIVTCGCTAYEKRKEA